MLDRSDILAHTGRKQTHSEDDASSGSSDLDVSPKGSKISRLAAVNLTKTNHGIFI